MPTAHIPSRLEPVGICRSDGKRPDGITVVPWKSSKLLVLHVTYPDTFTPSYLVCGVCEAGVVASTTDGHKRVKYSNLGQSYLFVLVAIKTTGVFGTETASFIRELHWAGDWDECSRCCNHLIQHLSLAVLMGNSASVWEVPEVWTHLVICRTNFLDVYPCLPLLFGLN